MIAASNVTLRIGKKALFDEKRSNKMIQNKKGGTKTMNFTVADIEKAFAELVALAHKIHDLVGGIMGVLGEECAFCETVHEVEM